MEMWQSVFKYVENGLMEQHQPFFENPGTSALQNVHWYPEQHPLKSTPEIPLHAHGSRMSLLWQMLVAPDSQAYIRASHGRRRQRLPPEEGLVEVWHPTLAPPSHRHDSNNDPARLVLFREPLHPICGTLNQNTLLTFRMNKEVQGWGLGISGWLITAGASSMKPWHRQRDWRQI